MHTTARTLLLASAAALTCLATTRGDHIPGHSDGDPIFPAPLPGQSDFNGGVLFGTLIGPDNGDTISNTTFDITWVSDGTTPASDLFIEIGIQLEDGYAETSVSGAALGFGSGPGTFHGEWSTDALNGVAVGGFFEFATIDLVVDAVGGGGIQGSGWFENSFILFDVGGGATPCEGDTNGDGAVDVEDIVNVILCWNTTGQDCPTPGMNTDVSQEGASAGRVDVSDLVHVILNYGAPCAAP